MNRPKRRRSPRDRNSGLDDDSSRRAKKRCCLLVILKKENRRSVMPEEIVAITIISIVAGTLMMITLAKMLFSYLRDRAGLSKRSASSPSLTTSELEGMLRRVVAEANEPLLDRVEALEDILSSGSKSLPPRREEPLLDELQDSANDLAAVTKRQGGRQSIS